MLSGCCPESIFSNISALYFDSCKKSHFCHYLERIFAKYCIFVENIPIK